MNDKRQKRILIPVIAAMLLSLTACGSASESTGSAAAGASNAGSPASADTQTSGTAAASEVPAIGDVIAADELFTDRDADPSYDTSASVTIDLDSLTASSDAVTFDGSTVTIGAEGVYILSGTLDGQLIVDAQDAKVQLVLSGASVTCTGSAALYVKEADKVFLTAEDGSRNTLASAGGFTADGDTNVDGTVFSKATLTVNGSGSLTVSSEEGSGIVCKKNLKICGSILTVDAAKYALEAKESVRVRDGSLTLAGDTDGIHAENDEAGEGWIYVGGGTLAVTAGSDALDATYAVEIDGGSLTIDAGDDGIHADEILLINGGTIDVGSSYEGLEAAAVTVNDGTIRIVSSDDGFNAAGGADSSGFGGTGRGRQEMFGSSSASLVINGGSIYVNAEGDGLDSNGSLTVNGGTVLVDGPVTSANGALDCGEGCTAEINGGTVAAVGASGMAETFGSGSQVSFLVVMGSTSGDISISDSEGNTIFTFSPAKSYASLVFSSADLKTGETYTVTAGDLSGTVTLTGTSGSFSLDGGTAGGMQGMGGGHGGMQGMNHNGDAAMQQNGQGMHQGGQDMHQGGQGTQHGGMGAGPSGTGAAA